MLAHLVAVGLLPDAAPDGGLAGQASVAHRGFRQSRSRSPGKSGLVISATASGTRLSAASGAWPFWPCPACPGAATSLRKCLVVKAEIQSRPAGCRSARMRAVVSMPLSPTSAMRAMPKRFLILSTCRPTVVGSAVFPGNTSTARGQPAAEHSSPNTICCLPFLPSRL